MDDTNFYPRRRDNLSSPDPTPHRPTRSRSQSRSVGAAADVPSPIDITTVQPGQVVCVDRTVAMEWSGGDAVVATGEVKISIRTNPPVRYIEVHVAGARKGSFEKVREDPRLLGTGES